VAERRDGDAGREIEVAPARLVPDLATAAANEHARRLPIVGIEMPLGDTEQRLLVRNCHARI